MKPIKYFTLALTLATLASCGGDSSTTGDSQACAASPLVGTWLLQSMTLQFKSNCTLSTTGCNQTGEFEASTASSGIIEVTIDSVDPDPGFLCLDQGTYDCAYDVSNGILTYLCD